MASGSITIDELIEDFGGLGPFQVLVLAVTSVTRTVGSMSMIMMAFGNYNPGWQCLDNATSADWNGGNLSMTTPITGSNDTNECRLYKACSNVQFTPGISTVVTEWELVCDRSWLSSLIISIQMAGLLLGSYLSGYLGDKFGRKRTLIAVSCYHVAVNVIAIFSNSWYMFAVIRFLIGIAIPFLVYTPVVLSVEFVPNKWRTFATSFPTFSFGSSIVALSAMATGDWKYVQGIIAICSFIAILPFYWVPESLRWLVVRDKFKEATAVVRNMAKLNGKKVDEVEIVEKIANRCKNQVSLHNSSPLRLLRQLFRKGVRYPTVAIGLLCVSMSMIFYAINFSVKSMPGDFFINLVILSCADIPLSPVSAILPNYIGRKLSIAIFLVVCITSLLIIVALDLGTEGSLKSIGILACVIMARIVIEGAWDTAVTYIGEVFPTVMRSTSIAYTSCIARIGGIIAPYLISDNPDTYYINYLIMASCALIACGLVIFLRETKGKPLQDVWEISLTKPEIEDLCVEESQQEGGNNARV